MFMFVCVCLKCLKTIENPADCEVLAVIHFLNAKGVKAADIHRQISEVYGKTL